MGSQIPDGFLYFFLSLSLMHLYGIGFFFQNCLSPLIKNDSLCNVNLEELHTNAEANAPKFLELAHRMDAAFLQKRFLLSVQKPELLIMEVSCLYLLYCIIMIFFSIFISSYLFY